MTATLERKTEKFSADAPVWNGIQEKCFFDAIEGWIMERLQAGPLTREQERALYRASYQAGLRIFLDSLEIKVIDDPPGSSRSACN